MVSNPQQEAHSVPIPMSQMRKQAYTGRLTDPGRRGVDAATQRLRSERLVTCHWRSQALTPQLSCLEGCLTHTRHAEKVLLGRDRSHLIS